MLSVSIDPGKNPLGSHSESLREFRVRHHDGKDHRAAGHIYFLYRSARARILQGRTMSPCANSGSVITMERTIGWRVTSFFVGGICYDQENFISTVGHFVQEEDYAHFLGNLIVCILCMARVVIDIWIYHWIYQKNKEINYENAGSINDIGIVDYGMACSR